MEYLVIIGLWVLYCIQQGFNDARHFAHGTGHYIKQQSDLHGYNIHSSLFLGRLIVFSSLLVFILFFNEGGNILRVVPLGIGLAALFPFFHEGTYYSTRKAMDSPNDYPNSHLALWVGYSSKSTTAKINFRGWMRVVAMIIGIFCIILFFK